MEIQAWLEDYQATARPMWREFFLLQQPKAQKTGPLPGKLLERFIDLFPRGKQARGALAVLGYELAGGNMRSEMVKASIALELMETAILIADDVFDDDRVRRGVPTIHKQWEKHFKTIARPNQVAFGHAMAHATSIIGFHLVPLLLGEVKLPEKNKRQAFTFYCQTLVETGYGEVLDIASSYESIAKKQGSAQTIHEIKTVRYTTVLPLKFGALLAGKSPGRWFTNLEDYALALGKVFQIQDDILGSFGKPEITGKSNLNDLLQGRWTILVELLWGQAAAKDRAVIRRLLQKPVRSTQEAGQLKRLMETYRVVELARRQAQASFQQGLALVPKLKSNRTQQTLLKNLLGFMLERTT
jgi:geranylgeranyl diphosphate synthase type I